MDDITAMLGEANDGQGLDEFESKSLPPYLLGDDTELEPLSEPVSAIMGMTPNSEFCGQGNLALCKLKIKGAFKDGDVIMFDGIVFTAKNKAVIYCQDDEFSISGDPSGEILAKRLFGKIFASKNKGIYRYLYDLNQDTITISSFFNTALPVAIYTTNDQSVEILKNKVPGVKPAIDLSTIRRLDCFIGSPEVEFSIFGNAVRSVHDNNKAASTAAPYTTEPFKEPVADGDMACLVKMNLKSDAAEKVDFTGCFFQSYIKNNISGQQLKMIETNSKEYFTINWTDSASASIKREKNYKHINVGSDLTIQDLNDFLNKCEFKQMVYLKLNDEREKIIDKEGEGGKVIASTEGAMASLSYNKTYAKKLEGFEIKKDHVYGGFIFSAKISGFNYTYGAFASDIPDLCYGRRVEMHSASGNVFAINLGYGGLTCLADAKYFAQASNAYRALFGLASKF